LFLVKPVNKNTFNKMIPFTETRKTKWGRFRTFSRQGNTDMFTFIENALMRKKKRSGAGKATGKRCLRTSQGTRRVSFGQSSRLDIIMIHKIAHPTKSKTLDKETEALYLVRPCPQACYDHDAQYE
jgi:hypothetical protein